MAVHRHDSAASLKSADKFGDAMRVLSRRSTRDVVVPAPPGRLARRLARPARHRLGGGRAAADRPAAGGAAPPAHPADPARGLLGAAGAGARWACRGALFAQIVSDALLVGLRRPPAQAGAAAGPAPCCRGPAGPGARAAPAPPSRHAAAVRVEGIPVRIPPRPAPLTAPLPIPAARYEDRPLVATSATSSSPGHRCALEPRARPAAHLRRQGHRSAAATAGPRPHQAGRVDSHPRGRRARRPRRPTSRASTTSSTVGAAPAAGNLSPPAPQRGCGAVR